MARALISLAVVILLWPTEPAHAETVFVKYRGPIDLAPFQCRTIARSSLVNRVCYDGQERYMLISLQGTYYHYCGIDRQTVSHLLAAESMGTYYNSYIRGQFDCRVNRVPAYR